MNLAFKLVLLSISDLSHQFSIVVGVKDSAQGDAEVELLVSDFSCLLRRVKGGLIDSNADAAEKEECFFELANRRVTLIREHSRVSLITALLAPLSSLKSKESLEHLLQEIFVLRANHHQCHQ